MCQSPCYLKFVMVIKRNKKQVAKHVRKMHYILRSKSFSVADENVNTLVT
jgi:hypothetical protein